MSIVALREMNAHGDVTNRILWEQSTPDEVRWGVPIYRVGGEYIEDAERIGGLVPIYDRVASLETMMAPACWRTYALQVAALFEPVKWNLLRAMWACGLIEASQSWPFSWWADFRPFPWRGLRRTH